MNRGCRTREPHGDQNNAEDATPDELKSVEQNIRNHRMLSRPLGLP
jgi:hypothetical protein